MGERRGVKRTWYCWGSLRKLSNLKSQGLDERVILKWIYRKWEGSIDLNQVAQGRSRRREIVNAVMNFVVA